jgi:very-short-patch-repair endonuclease
VQAVAKSLINRARELRLNQSDAEQFLWSKLRGHRFLNIRFRRQVVIGNYIVDFYCVSAKLVIELDGGQYNLPENIIYDVARTRYLEGRGLEVVRFWNNDIFNNPEGVLEVIRNQVLTWHPHPTLSRTRSAQERENIHER